MKRVWCDCPWKGVERDGRERRRDVAFPGLGGSGRLLAIQILQRARPDLLFRVTSAP
jgi:hypothetical protein